MNDAPPSSRFSAVVEKIERLYMVYDIKFRFLLLWDFCEHYKLKEVMIIVYNDLDTIFYYI